MPELVLVEQIEAGIASVTLNQGERRNALSIELIRQLCDALGNLGRDPSQRVVILRGAGPVFSAGLDLREAADSSLIESSAAGVAEALQLLRSTPLVVIAAVQGGVFAGGAGIMAACDIVVCAEDATISFPEARRGLLPALISRVLRHKVREGDLRYLFLTGSPVTAVRARDMGLVQCVAPADQLVAESLAVAKSVAAGGPNTIRQTKALLNEMFENSADSQRAALVAVHLEARRAEEAREGLTAFIEKRTPNW